MPLCHSERRETVGRKELEQNITWAETDHRSSSSASYSGGISHSLLGGLERWLQFVLSLHHCVPTTEDQLKRDSSDVGASQMKEHSSWCIAVLPVSPKTSVAVTRRGMSGSSGALNDAILGNVAVFSN